MLTLMNEWMPFSDGGDDLSYYQLADPPVQSLGDVFDLTRFIGEMEQPGYPWLLSILNALTGHDLLVYKSLNFFFLLILAFTWYRIGLILVGPRYARRLVILILVFTPLWFYVFVLLKDMTITLLQSLFILAAIQIWHRAQFRPVFLALTTSFLLILFRSALIIQNMAVMLGGYSIKSLGSRVDSYRWLPFVFSIILVIPLYLISTNPQIMNSLGIYSEYRVISSVDFGENAKMYLEQQLNTPLFLIIYLFSEVAGFNSQTWLLLDAAWLRSVLAIPWILFGVPFFVVGFWILLKPLEGARVRPGIISSLQQSKAVSTPWSLLFVFIISSIVISWIVGDTTRWRIPDFPMVIAIALYGWMYSGKRVSQKIMLVWLILVSIFFTFFYAYRG